MPTLNKYAAKTAAEAMRPARRPKPKAFISFNGRRVSLIPTRKETSNFFFKIIPGRFPWRLKSREDAIRAYGEYRLDER
jgi:hypothetical protein